MPPRRRREGPKGQARTQGRSLAGTEAVAVGPGGGPEQNSSRKGTSGGFCALKSSSLPLPLQYRSGQSLHFQGSGREKRVAWDDSPPQSCKKPSLKPNAAASLSNVLLHTSGARKLGGSVRQGRQKLGASLKQRRVACIHLERLEAWCRQNTAPI